MNEERSMKSTTTKKETSKMKVFFPEPKTSDEWKPFNSVIGMKKKKKASSIHNRQNESKRETTNYMHTYTYIHNHIFMASMIKLTKTIIQIVKRSMIHVNETISQ